MSTYCQDPNRQFWYHKKSLTEGKFHPWRVKESYPFLRFFFSYANWQVPVWRWGTIDEKIETNEYKLRVCYRKLAIDLQDWIRVHLIAWEDGPRSASSQIVRKWRNAFRNLNKNTTSRPQVRHSHENVEISMEYSVCMAYVWIFELWLLPIWFYFQSASIEFHGVVQVLRCRSISLTLHQNQSIRDIDHIHHPFNLLFLDCRYSWILLRYSTESKTNLWSLLCSLRSLWYRTTSSSLPKNAIPFSRKCVEYFIFENYDPSLRNIDQYYDLLEVCIFWIY